MGLRVVREPEEITRQLEERYAELEAEKRRMDSDPHIQRPCSTCKFSYYHNCKNALVTGFDRPPPNMEWLIEKGYYPSSNWPTVELCGHEKALWQPRKVKQKALNVWSWESWAWFAVGIWIIFALSVCLALIT